MDKPDGNACSIKHYVDTLVTFLSDVQYNEPHDIPSAQLRSNFEFVYEEILHLFTQPAIQELLKIDYKATTKATRTIARMAVTCWPNISREIMVPIAIHFTTIHFLDDSPSNSHEQMGTFLADLLQGSEQKSPCWRMMLDQIPNLLRHFGPYLQYGIFRSTIDFYQCCWIEVHGFQGDRGSDRYPGELRRLGALGVCLGSFMFPKAVADETRLFGDITSAIVHTEPIGALINDLFSFYKEIVAGKHYGAVEDINLVTNVCRVKGLSIQGGFDQIAADTTRSVLKAREVFDGSHAPVVEDGIHAFIHGYIRWHFCDRRYRMEELYDASYGLQNGELFRGYCDMAWKAGGVYMDERMFAAVESRVAGGLRLNGSL